MNKKSLIQLLVSLFFFGITAYVVFGFFNISENKFSSGVLSNDSAETIDVSSLLNRNFKTEQTDIFEKETFKQLKDNSVLIPEVDKNDVGKKNPFKSSE